MIFIRGKDANFPIYQKNPKCVCEREKDRDTQRERERIK